METTGEDSGLEDGWERVTRFRSRSASSGRCGNHSHKHAKDSRTKNKKSSDSSTSRSESSASIEPSTPSVFDEPPSIGLSATESKPSQEEGAVEQEDKMAESSAIDENDGIPLEEVAEVAQVSVEEVKKETEEPVLQEEKVSHFVCTYMYMYVNIGISIFMNLNFFLD